MLINSQTNYYLHEDEDSDIYFKMVIYPVILYFCSFNFLLQIPPTVLDQYEKISNF